MVDTNTRIATEIGVLVNKLNPDFQSYALNIISTLLFSQQTSRQLELSEDKDLTKQKELV